MSTFAVVLFCVQACLVQVAFSYCARNAGAGYGAHIPAPAAVIAPTHGCGEAALTYGVTPAALAGGLGYSGALGHGVSVGYGPYISEGEGNVAAFGELPVAGNAAFIGQVPVSGAVSFNGNVPAVGSVYINGHCACGCGY